MPVQGVVFLDLAAQCLQGSQSPEPALSPQGALAARPACLAQGLPSLPPSLSLSLQLFLLCPLHQHVGISAGCVGHTTLRAQLSDQEGITEQGAAIR